MAISIMSAQKRGENIAKTQDCIFVISNCQKVSKKVKIFEKNEQKYEIF